MDEQPIGTYQIKAITDAGIGYLDENGVEKFIDFAACYADWRAWVESQDYWEQMKREHGYSDEMRPRFLGRLDPWKQVGFRTTSAAHGGPYIQLHANPPVRFKFADINDYYEVRDLILAAGWQLSDESLE